MSERLHQSLSLNCVHMGGVRHCQDGGQTQNLWTDFMSCCRPCSVLRSVGVSWDGTFVMARVCVPVVRRKSLLHYEICGCELSWEGNLLAFTVNCVCVCVCPTWHKTCIHSPSPWSPALLPAVQFSEADVNKRWCKCQSSVVKYTTTSCFLQSVGFTDN